MVDNQLSDKPLSIAVTSDSHLNAGENPLSNFYGPEFNLYERAETVLQHLASRESSLNCAIHNGDVVNRGHIPSYNSYNELITDALPAVPKFYSVGNHDVGSALFDHLEMGSKDIMLGEEKSISYRFEREQNVFFVLDGTVEGDVKSARINDATLEWLQAQLQEMTPTQSAWIFSHYPAFKQAPTLPDTWALQNGEALHTLLKRFGNQVRAVFSGHVHAAYETVSMDGIDYVSLSSASEAFRAGKSGPEFDPDAPIGYDLLHISNDGSYNLERVAVPIK